MIDRTRPIEDPKAALDFMFAGNARFTIVSKDSGRRYTYRLRKMDRANSYFVSVLYGPGNESDYRYIGTAQRDRMHGAGRKVSANDPRFVAITWAIGQLNRRQGQAMHPALEVWHEGRCGRCARPLTDPESIARGYGPHCAGAE